MSERISGEDITGALIFLAVFSLVHNLLRKPKGIPPGPAYTLPVCDLLPMAQGDIRKTFRKLRNNHGDIFSFYVGRHLTVVVNGYELIKKVLQFCGHPQNGPMALRANGTGLILSNGDAWRKHRQFVEKALYKVGISKKAFEENS